MRDKHKLVNEIMDMIIENEEKNLNIEPTFFLEMKIHRKLSKVVELLHPTKLSELDERQLTNVLNAIDILVRTIKTIESEVK